MSREIIKTDQAPQAIGTYSQAVKVRSTVYLSGQIALDPQSMTMVEGDTEAEIRRVLDNLQAVARAMIARGQGGKIINMASQAGRRGEALVAVYCASKAAVINLAESLKLELRGTGVDLTLISPGFVDTPLNAAYDPKKKLFVMKKERCARKILAKLPKRPYEIAFPIQVEGFLKTVRDMPRFASFPVVRWFIKATGA